MEIQVRMESGTPLDKANITIAKMEEVEKIKTEVTGIDKELTKSLKEPMKLIKQRTEAVQHLAETKSQVSYLIGELHWNNPKDETVPFEPAILGKLKKLIDPQKRRGYPRVRERRGFEESHASHQN